MSVASGIHTPQAGPATNSPTRVLAASLIGTTIEFFDFYIYATAAVLVFPSLFFPSTDPSTAVLQSLATFAIAFFARPIGAALFGHFGDRIGRKATLVAALMTMGLSTIIIGLLPTYATAGVIAPLLLALCRLGQGLGLGGEWGGAVLLATENAPKGKEAWYGMFPQLGAPIGFILSSGSFFLLVGMLDDADFMAWGWRIPFIASALLVFLGLYIRLRIAETPAFQKVLDKQEQVRIPVVTLFKEQKWNLVMGTVACLATFVLFYIMTVFFLNWGTTELVKGGLGFTRTEFLPLQMLGVVFFGVGIPIAAVLADRFGRIPTLVTTSAAIAVFALSFPLFFTNNITDSITVIAFLVIGFLLMGFTYGPIGTALAEPFPAAVRYTGASMTFNLGGILGASLAPYIATYLVQNHGIAYVGYYLAGAAIITIGALLGLGKHRSTL